MMDAELELLYLSIDESLLQAPAQGQRLNEKEVRVHRR